MNKNNIPSKLYKFVVEQKFVPWRVSNSFDMWLENYARAELPAFYRLCRFKRLRDISRPLTFGPKHHFFGYYDKSPWNKSGELILSHEVDFQDRPPTEEDPAVLGCIRRDNGNFEPLARTRAWNWQQGSMLQWHPKDTEGTFVYNDCRSERYVGVVHNIDKGEVVELERPVYAMSPCGEIALSLSFSRLQHTRPGYGYAGVRDPYENVGAPERDGIYHVNLKSGSVNLLFSLNELAEKDVKPSMRNTQHWVNHIQISPNGKRFAFMHRWRLDGGNFGTRLYTARLDGSELCCVLSGTSDSGRIGVSHYDWMTDESLLAWAQFGEIGERFVIVDYQTGAERVFGDGVLIEDGHCSFSPDRRWVLNDTYPDRHGMRTLMIVGVDDERRLDLDRFLAPNTLRGEIRCDLHPRWSRDGRSICVDSAHRGERQMYLVSLDGIIG